MDRREYNGDDESDNISWFADDDDIDSNWLCHNDLLNDTSSGEVSTQIPDPFITSAVTLGSCCGSLLLE